MKNLSEIIKTLSGQHIKEIQKVLKIKETHNISNRIYAEYLSFSGMEHILSSLNHNEINILNTAFEEKNGITFAEIEKRLSIGNEQVEKLSNKLAGLMLVSILKNRQKLNNKLDRINLLPEIRNTLNPINYKTISGYYNEINHLFEAKEYNKYKNSIHSINTALLDKIKYIFNAGGIITLHEFYESFPEHSSLKDVSDLINNKHIHVYHDLIQSGRTILILDKKLFISCQLESVEKTDIPLNVHNRFYMLINLLKSYDTVSTYGLFLTKQKEFRKVDRKHLDESMIKLTNYDGSVFDNSKISQLSLYLLYLLNCTDIKDGSLIISLKNIENHFDKPFEWLQSIIRKLQDIKDDIILNPPFDLPEYKEIIPIIQFINKNPHQYKCIRQAFFVKKISQLQSFQFAGIKQIKQNTIKTFDICVRFLCIAGIIEVKKHIIQLSDVGLGLAERVQNTGARSGAHGEINSKDKKIFMDSNFTLVSPKAELSSEALYHILTHTEIITDDVLLHTRISRESILSSMKRGMKNDKFFATLKKYLKIDIPDNLNFLISEWQIQTIKFKIFNAAVLYVNQPSFLDKITHSKIKNSIIKRIAPDYALIDRKYIDLLIKMAKDNDAVINLFDEAEDIIPV